MTDARCGKLRPGAAYQIDGRLGVAAIYALFLSALGLGESVRSLVALSVDMTDVCPAAHWARQRAPPDDHAPDEDLYLPGRNVVLLEKTAVSCATKAGDRV